MDLKKMVLNAAKKEAEKAVVDKVTRASSATLTRLSVR